MCTHAGVRCVLRSAAIHLHVSTELSIEMHVSTSTCARTCGGSNPVYKQDSDPTWLSTAFVIKAIFPLLRTNRGDVLCCDARGAQCAAAHARARSEHLLDLSECVAAHFQSPHGSDSFGAQGAY